MKKIITLLILTALLASCKSNNKSSLEGEIKGLGNDTIYLYGIDETYGRIDTILVEKDKFSWTLDIDTTITVLISSKEIDEYPLFLDKTTHIKIKGSAENLNHLTIEGNAANEAFSSFQASLKGIDAPSEKKVQGKAEAFIRQHNTSPVSIYLLNKYFIQLEKPDFNKISELISILSGSLQDSPTISRTNDYIEKWNRACIGKTAPFFRLFNQKGESITRQEKFKDQFLLVNFWASWDDTAGKEFAELRKIHHKYKKNKEFGMLGISLDIDKKSWKKAIEQDTLTWEQACDFNGINSEITQLFAIQKLPAYVLITPTGKIIARDIPVDSLLNELGKVLKKEEKRSKK